ncbi:ATP-binding cassette sub-family F member 2 [Plecturocebus cupreus]
MPSDLAKKKAAKKKEAAKARQWPRKGHEENGDAVTEPHVAEEKNEASGGETTEVDLLTKELEDLEMKLCSSCHWRPGLSPTTLTFHYQPLTHLSRSRAAQ